MAAQNTGAPLQVGTIVTDAGSLTHNRRAVRPARLRQRHAHPLPEPRPVPPRREADSAGTGAGERVNLLVALTVKLLGLE